MRIEAGFQLKVCLYSRALFSFAETAVSVAGIYLRLPELSKSPFMKNISPLAQQFAGVLATYEVLMNVLSQPWRLAQSEFGI